MITPHFPHVEHHFTGNEMAMSAFQTLVVGGMAAATPTPRLSRQAL